MGYVFAAARGVFTLVGLTFAVLQFLTGRALERQNHRTLCLVTAGFTCIFIPYGTALGIFTFMVLGRPAVQSLFQRKPFGP